MKKYLAAKIILIALGILFVFSPLLVYDYDIDPLIFGEIELVLIFIGCVCFLSAFAFADASHYGEPADDRVKDWTVFKVLKLIDHGKYRFAVVTPVNINKKPYFVKIGERKRKAQEGKDGEIKLHEEMYIFKDPSEGYLPLTLMD